MYLDQNRDNASGELVGLARACDYGGFRALASCLMPIDEIEECWRGARARLGRSDGQLVVPDDLPPGTQCSDPTCPCRDWAPGDVFNRRMVVILGRSFVHPVLGSGGIGQCRTLAPDPICACGAIRIEWADDCAGEGAVS